MTEPIRCHFVASNLHVGGGVQVAASLVDELLTLSRTNSPEVAGLELSIEVSREVLRNLAGPIRKGDPVAVVHRRRFDPVQSLRDLRAAYDCVYIIFGPIYTRFRTSRVIMGYADVTSILDNPLGSRPSLRSRIRALISRRQARRRTTLVAETPAFRDAIVDRIGVDPASVRVIPNAVNSASTGAGKMEFDLKSTGEVWAYPARDYPHKNLDFLPDLRNHLDDLGVRVRFAVTLTESEWGRRGPQFHQSCINVGELTVENVGALIRGSDAVIFPSLLEAFSATPIEALANGTLLIAADRDFVRSVVGTNAIYFEPTNPRLAAAQIVEGLTGGTPASHRIERGLEFAASLPDASDRAKMVLQVVRGVESL